jgi:hypothetical protein
VILKLTHQVDGDDEIVLLILPFLCLLASLDSCGFRLGLHLPLLRGRRLLDGLLRPLRLSALLAGHWCLLSSLSLLVDVATAICGLVAGLKHNHDKAYNALHLKQESSKNMPLRINGLQEFRHRPRF